MNKLSENDIKTPWSPSKPDLVFSIIITILLPFLAQFLYLKTGAFIPMVLYYGIAWGIVKWRRGSTGYFNQLPKKIPKSFYFSVGVILLCLICAYYARIITTPKDITGIILTAIFWATINAATEQLLWIYIFESWDLYPSQKPRIFRIIGLILFSAFVGLIHTMYWIQFLHTVDSSMTIGIIFVLLTTVSGFLHLIVWRKSNHMIFTFIPHFLLNLIPLFWTNYSIIPFLFL
jgi:hypothetical protein